MYMHMHNMHMHMNMCMHMHMLYMHVGRIYYVGRPFKLHGHELPVRTMKLYYSKGPCSGRFLLRYDVHTVYSGETWLLD